jgi:hypothetical protein
LRIARPKPTLPQPTLKVGKPAEKSGDPGIPPVLNLNTKKVVANLKMHPELAHFFV